MLATLNPKNVGLAVLAALLAAALAAGFVLAAQLDAARREAAALGERNAALTAENEHLKAAQSVSVMAGAALSAIGQTALARREALDDIFVCPAPEEEPAALPEGERINAKQSRQLVDYWNSLFAGLGTGGGLRL